MQLTSAQKVTLAAHIRANTNSGVIPGSGGQTFVINAAVAGRDPTLQQGMANWYNQTALAGDNQPFANLNVWNPITTIAQLNTAMKFLLTTPLQGSSPTDVQITNALLMWQIMTWSLGAIATTPVGLDMSDTQVRTGVLAVWGDVTANPANAKQIGAVGCGQQVGRNIELVLSGAVTGASAGNAFANAHVVQKDAIGGLVYSQSIQAVDIDAALFPNG